MNARATAAKIIHQVLDQCVSLDNAFEQHLNNNVNDSAFIKQLCFGCMRWLEQLNSISNELLHKPIKPSKRIVQVLLMLGIYQVLHLDTPAHAAVNETVAACRQLKQPWATGLLNKTLRILITKKQNYLEKISNNPRLKFSHPDWLYELLKQHYPNNYQHIMQQNNQQAPLFLRVNLSKTTREQYLQQLQQAGIEAVACDAAASAIQLISACDVQQLTGFAEGFCSVQDLAGQLMGQLLPDLNGKRVLDACAAPGSKTCLLLEQHPKIKHLVALDKSEQRLQRLQENLNRLAVPAAQYSIQAESAEKTKKWWDNSLFDMILLDSPCSATGVIRRHPDIKYLRRASDIQSLAQTQYQLFTSLVDCLAPNGYLLYSTCSILPEENDAIIQRVIESARLKPQSIQLPLGEATQFGWQILPGSSDGFYFSLLKLVD